MPSTGTLKSLSDRYKREPTVENYLALRRAHPEAKIEVAVIGGIDVLFFMEPEFRRYGIDPEDIASIMDADLDAISKVSLLLLEKLAVRHAKAKVGTTHLGRGKNVVIPEKLVDWTIACALDALSWNGILTIPRDLIVLIRERLIGQNPYYSKAFNADLRRSQAIEVAAQIVARGEKPGVRAMAEFLKVEPSTVSRWLASEKFKREIQARAGWYDGSGKPKPMTDKHPMHHKKNSRKRLPPTD